MKIDGKKRRALREALIQAFPLPIDLQMLTDEVLDLPLQNAVGINGSMEEIAFELIQWVEARGRLTELVMGAASANSKATRLQALAAQFRFAADVAGEVERINLKDVPFENVGQWLNRLSQLRRAVCRVEPQPPPNTGGYGTGFLVAPDVLLTNYHVVAPFIATGGDKVRFRFDFELAQDGVSEPSGRTTSLAADWLLMDSPVAELDFALVRIAEKAADDSIAGEARGYIPLSRTKPAAGNPLIILQHPDAKPLKLSIGSIAHPDTHADRLSYTANTEPGSSGSPCFSSSLDLVALHHWGDKPNRGVRVAALQDHLFDNRAIVDNLGLAHLLL